MSEETKQQTEPTEEPRDHAGAMQVEQGEYDRIRDILRADRRPEQLVADDEDQSLASIAIEVFAESRENVELSGEITVSDDGRAEATMWVTEPFSCFDGLNQLAGDFVAHLGPTLTVMVFGYEDTELILEVIAVNGDSYQDFRITFAGPHVQHAVKLSDAWHDSMATDFQA